MKKFLAKEVDASDPVFWTFSLIIVLPTLPHSLPQTAKLIRTDPTTGPSVIGGLPVPPPVATPIFIYILLAPTLERWQKLVRKCGLPANHLVKCNVLLLTISRYYVTCLKGAIEFRLFYLLTCLFVVCLTANSLCVKVREQLWNICDLFQA